MRRSKSTHYAAESCRCKVLTTAFLVVYIAKRAISRSPHRILIGMFSSVFPLENS